MWWETRPVSALSPLGALGWRGGARHSAGPSLRLDQAGSDSYDCRLHLTDKQDQRVHVLFSQILRHFSFILYTESI